MAEPIGLDVSRETLERLEIYVGLLQKWTRKINLIAPGTISTIWERHIRDSAQVFDVAGITKGRWVDLGSGGGLPGVVIALLATELAPELDVSCVESDQRKAVFLGVVSRETGVPFRVIADRIEHVPPLGAAILSARALAPLDVLMGYAARHLAPNGLAVFQKGARHQKERLDAEKNWRFDVQTFTSNTDTDAVIYKLGAPRRA
jgi:16S rRNA (guanine527-N7)-methyltransferase